MSILGNQILETLAPGLVIPEAVLQLFDWIEANGLFVDRDGRRYGVLYPSGPMSAAWNENSRPGGTNIEFHAGGNAALSYWFGHTRPEVLSRLSVFAQTGADGSMAAFWLDDQGTQKIVHLGSGSGSTLVCILADEPVDFLRLLAIGYDEICWNDVFDSPPNQPESELIVAPNEPYRAWVSATFHTTIPSTALEVVKHPAEMSDAESPDVFWRWVKENT